MRIVFLLKLFHSCWIFCSFYSSFFSLCISFWEIYLDKSWSSLILSSVMSSLLISPAKTFCISVMVSLISSISLQFFLWVSIILLTFPICYCMLSIFSSRVLDILIRVILDSLSDNSKAFFPFSLPSSLPFFLLPFRISGNFCCCWKSDMMYQVIELRL